MALDVLRGVNVNKMTDVKQSVLKIPYLAALFLVLHSGNMYTIILTWRKKYQGGMKLRYRLRAIAMRLSNELAVLDQKWRQNKPDAVKTD